MYEHIFNNTITTIYQMTSFTKFVYIGSLDYNCTEMIKLINNKCITCIVWLNTTNIWNLDGRKDIEYRYVWYCLHIIYSPFVVFQKRIVLTDPIVVKSIFCCTQLLLYKLHHKTILTYMTYSIRRSLTLKCLLPRGSEYSTLILI